MLVPPSVAAARVATTSNDDNVIAGLLGDNSHHHLERKRQRRRKSEREWYLKHREDRLAKQRDYDAKNRERRLQQMKDYRTKHKEKQRVYKQEWYRRNRDSIKMKRMQRKDDGDDDQDELAIDGVGEINGSFVCDSLRELYPTSYLLNTVVWPYRSGEVIVQNYNTLLTMACLSESSDGVLIVENDLADQICRRLLAIPTPSFHQMNQVLTNHIAAMLMPALPFQVGKAPRFKRRSNSQAILPQVESMLDKAHRMFTSNAYVHQYAIHGVDADFFQSCFLRLDQMVVNYTSM
ncbi:hypothetical protein B5M09_007121 [Aphanomyces astaci]|uniref:Uncharacterized protein n=1 Tax=Aphanomyces astaci TaxID=112090 RepID=A0A425DFJ4_APHAT|nr:hypothetical protein B5M09_007121 [Aphanomyces astaci]